MDLDPDQILQTAQAWVEQQAYPQALAEYEKLLRVNPGDTKVLLRVGDVQARMGDFAAAIATYVRAAVSYAEQGISIKAIAVYKQVREMLWAHQPELASHYAHTLEHLTQLYKQMGMVNDALRTLDEEANHLREAGRDDDALVLFRQMTNVGANIPLPYLRLAEGLYRVGEVDEALTAFWSATQLLLANDRADDALRVIERMLHVKPHHKHAKVAARLYLEKGTEAEGMQALSRLQLCFQADPSDLETLHLLSRAFDLIGHADRSLEVQKELARLAHEQGQPEVFQNTVNQLHARAPHDEVVRNLLGLPLPEQRPARASVVPNALKGPPPKPADARASVRPPPTQAPPPKPAGRLSVAPPLPPGYVGSAGVASPGVGSVDGVGSADIGSAGAGSANLGLAGAVAPAPLSAPKRPPPSRPGAPPSSSGRGRVPPPLGSSPRSSRAGAVPPSAVGHALESRPPSSASASPAAASSPPKSRPADKAASSPPVALERATSPGDPPSASRGRLKNLDDVLANSRRSLQEAQSFREQKLFHKGIETVQNALDYDPRSIQLREVLRDLYTDVGDRDGAITEMLTMAEIYVEFERPDHALTVLANILEEEPGCEEARMRVAQLEQEFPEMFEGRTSGHPEPTQRSSVPPAFPGFAAGNGSRPPAAPERTAHLPPMPSLEEALEQVEAYATRGLFDEARRMLELQKHRTPDNPLVRDAEEELEEAIRSSRTSGDLDAAGAASTSAAPARSGSKPAASKSTAPKRPGDSLDIDLQNSLAELENAVRESMRPPAPGQRVSNLDVDDLFDKFKASVKAQVADGDSATHYDLGLAYKDMGMLDDAIEEFELAARDPEHECDCFATVGLIYAEQGIWEKASKAYSRALGAAKRTPAQEARLYYDLGHVAEMAGQLDQSLYYFRQVLRREPDYEDAAERVQLLRAKRQRTGSGRPKAQDEEVDRAFEGLLGD